MAARLRAFNLESSSNFDCYSASNAIPLPSFLSLVFVFSNRSFFWFKVTISLLILYYCWLVLFLSFFLFSTSFWVYRRCEFLCVWIVIIRSNVIKNDPLTNESFFWEVLDQNNYVHTKTPFNSSLTM